MSDYKRYDQRLSGLSINQTRVLLRWLWWWISFGPRSVSLDVLQSGKKDTESHLAGHLEKRNNSLD